MNIELIRIDTGIAEQAEIPEPIVLTRAVGMALKEWRVMPTDPDWDKAVQSWAYRHGYEVPEDIEEATTNVKSYTKHSKAGKTIRVKQYVRVLHGTKQSVLDSILAKGIIPQDYKNWDQYTKPFENEKKVFVTPDLKMAQIFGRAAAREGPFAVIEADIPSDVKMKKDKRVEGAEAFTLDVVKPEWIKRIHFYRINKSYEYHQKAITLERTVVVNEATAASTRVFIPVPLGHPLVQRIPGVMDTTEVAQRLLPFKLLQERKTSVKAHKSRSKRGKVYNVRQYDRDLRDAMAPKSVSFINKRAWKNTPAFVATKYRLTDQESGALGENLVIEALKLKGWKKARPLNIENPSAPFDAIYDRTLVEVKTGNAYNQVAAMKWSINYGGTNSKEHKKKIKQMSEMEKKRYYKERFKKIMKAKKKTIDKFEAKYGHRFKVETVGVILNTKKKRADIYHTPGTWKQLRWRKFPENYRYTVGYSL